jgi:hypothetical protein
MGQSEPFWYIKMVHGTAQTQFYWARDRLFDRPICQILFEIVSAQEQARVIDVRSQYVDKARNIRLHGGLETHPFPFSQADEETKAGTSGDCGVATEGVAILPHVR